MKFNNVHKTLIVISAIAIATVIGCTIKPSVESMYNISQSVGYSAGLIVKELNLPADSINATVDIVNEVVFVTPETNQTFEVAWTPIAQNHIAALVEKGKIDAQQGNIILLGFRALTMSVDWVMNKYPKAKETKELTSAVIDGSAMGFLAVVRPVNFSFSASPTRIDVSEYANKEAYEYLRSELLRKE